MPAGHGHISAGDEFINRTVAAIAERLRAGGIVPGFGIRYPAGGFHNLLQVFTPRHLESPLPALRRLAAIAATGAIDAVQLELSVAVRMPGSMRNCALDAIGAAFPIDAARARDRAPAIELFREVVRTVVRTPAAKAPALAALKALRPGIPARAGIEFFDPSAGIGAMASFDLGPAAMGARIMVMLDHRRVALFTGEGAVRRDGGRISLGPLTLHADGREIALTFRGPAVVVPDARVYLSIERALASGILDEAALISVRLQVPDASLNLEEVLRSGMSIDPVATDPVAAFGRLTGTITIAGETRMLDGVGRAGLSFTGIGSPNFVSRRMVWACLPASSPYSALEARLITNEDGTGHRAAQVFGSTGMEAMRPRGVRSRHRFGRVAARKNCPDPRARRRSADAHRRSAKLRPALAARPESEPYLHFHRLRELPARPARRRRRGRWNVRVFAPRDAGAGRPNRSTQSLRSRRGGRGLIAAA